MAAAPVRYARMNGIGNEILVLDLRDGSAAVRPEVARLLAARPETACDQIMALLPAAKPGTAARVDIFNNDGSTAAACGNGTRCIAFLAMRESGADRVVFETAAGVLEAWDAGDGMISVDMGRPRFALHEIPVAPAYADPSSIRLAGEGGRPELAAPELVSLGNPHAVFFVEDPGLYDLAVIGPPLEQHPAFPERANISIAKVAGRDWIVLKVWERGAGATRACGSAACATAVAAARTQRTGRQVRISLPGGDLTIDWRADDHVVMTGPVELEREGMLAAELFAAAADTA